MRCLEAGVWGAYYNIAINLPDITDESYKEKVHTYSSTLNCCRMHEINFITTILGN